MVLFLDEKYKKAKKFVLLFAFFISLVFLAKTVSAGCCIATDYSGYYTANNAMGCDGFYYDVNCNDKSLEPYISQMCCILNISQTNKCYYGSMKFCEYKAEQEGATDYELSDGDYGADGTLCSLSNVQGTCPSPLPEVNCSKTYNIIVQGCIDEEGKSAFFCTREGKLISNCELCLEDNCGSLVCNKQTGSCEMVSANNCTTIGYECCADCKSDKSEPRYDYGTENEGSCPQNLPRCCEECKTTQYCCEFKSQCPESTGKGSCSSGWECSHACEQWNCALNQKIASSSNQHEVCWCSNEKRYTASDSGWCCEVPGVEGGVYSPVSCSEIGEAKVSGLVKDSAESKGIAGAWVFLPAHGIVSLPTGATGDYSISGLKTGVSYTVSAYASGYYMLSKRILMDALDKSVDFLMIKIGSTQCNPVHPAAISGFKAFGQQGKKEVSVEWDKNCSELISAYYLKRKDWSAAIILPASADSYIDSNVEWGKNYTYEIRAIYQNKNTPISSTTVKMGSALCEGVLPGNEFCLDSQNRKNTENATLRRTCDENNNVAENVYINTGVYGYETADCSEYDAAEGGEHLCVLTKGFPQEGTGEVISRCKRKDACEATGNPLGLFYDRNVCYAFDYNCYYEFSGTSVDICADCNAKLKCFDFISKESCMNNDCGLKCNWTSTNKEFSKGICYPEEEYTGTEYCDLCNNLFMNCDEDTCSKLGKCIAKQDGCSVCPASTNCSSYKDQKSCEGYPFDMINYCNQEHPNTNDACHLVRCSWNSTSNTCIKDGNFDKIDDCKNFYLLEKSSCEKDNTPPLTKITSDLTIHKNDKINFTMSEPVKEFVYCIDKEDNCCPSINKTFDSGGEANKWQISPLEDDATQYVFQSNGIYYVRFYATDKYDNVEAVESVPIYVIKNILDAKVVALFTNADKYNLTVITEMSAPAKCSFEINPDIRNSIVKNDFAISEYKLYLELQFKNVNYTSYRFVLNCRDEYANEYNGTFPLRKYGESKFNISIIAPYYPNGVPAISYGSYLLMLNFSESVNVNAVNYQLVDGSYKGMIEYKGNSEGKKEWSYRIIVPNNENAVKEIEGFMNAQLKITAVSEGNPEIIYTEADADNPFFTIDTKPPTAEITIG